MTESNPDTTATINLPITVVPCAVIAVSAITKLEAELGGTAT